MVAACKNGSEEEITIEASIAGTLVYALEQALKDRGIASSEGSRDLNGNGLPSDPEERVPFRRYAEMIGRARQAAAQPGLFLDIGQGFMTMPPIIQHLIRHAPTYDEKISQVLRYARLMCDYFDFGLRENEDECELSFAFAGPSRVSVSVIEAVMTHMYCGLKSTWADFEAARITFGYPAPADVEPYRRRFFCPLQFGAADNKIVFSRTYMAHPVSAVHDDYLYDLLKERADALMERVMPPDRSVAARVRAILTESLPTGGASVVDTADKLHMSRQTLFRKLQQEHTSYREVLAECRRELSLIYIRRPELSLESIAFLLGYSEASAFQKAFRRWHGMSPGACRRPQAAR